MKRLLSLVIILAAAVVAVSAQTVVRGSVANKSGEALAGSTVLFIHADTIVGGTATDSKGKFELKGLPKGDYECRVSILGYKSASQKFSLSENVRLPQFMLEKDATVLGEVKVEGDARKLTKELAGMSIYYLTGRAKKEPNVYLALREIPRLRVNEVLRSITLENGISPLILVDGVKKPLDVLSPEFIESVEVIDNPSARYRGEATVASVLNIKLKKEGIKPYLRGELGVNSMLNANFFYTSGSFEIGTATSSLYLNGGYTQTRKGRDIIYSDIYQGNIHKEQNSDRRTYWRNPFVSFGGDKVFSEKNYVAFNLKYLSTPSGGETDTDGEITDLTAGKTSPLTSFFDNDNRYKQLASNLYYKHTFNSRRILEITGYYYYTLNGNTSNRKETCEFYSYETDIDLDNSRNMGRIDVNYSDMLTKTMHLDAGSNTEYSVTNIDDRLDSWPNFRYRRTREYVYAGIDNNRSSSRFNYVVSLGFDMVFSDADGERNSYVDFIPSLSLSYKVANAHRLSLTYNRSRQMPSAGALNPRNTSTDKLTVSRGNPLLKPSHADNVKFGYVFSNGKVWFNPFIEYSYNSDLIMPYEYLDGDDVYVRTYKNYGHSGKVKAGMSLSYNFPQKNGFYGNAGLYAEYSYSKEYTKEKPFSEEAGYLGLNSFIGYKRVSLNMNVGWNPPGHSLYGRFNGGFQSNAFFGWNVSNSVRLTMSAESFLCGRRPYKSWTDNGDYHSFSKTVHKSLTPRIQVGVWFTFQTKNFKWRNKKQFNGGDEELKSVTTK